MRASLNGTLIDAEAPALAAGDRGFTLGDGVFETLAVRDGQVRRQDRHLDRLHHGLAVLGIAPPDRAELAAALEDTRAANALSDGVLRLSVSRGPGGRGVAAAGAGPATVLVTAQAGRPPQTPLSAVVARALRRNPRSPTSRIKSLSYLDNVLARREAERRGAGEALLLDTRGRLAEASVANVVLDLDGAAVTPPLADGALPGVTRAVLLEAGLLTVARVPGAALNAAREIVLINSLGVRAVICLDGRAVGAGATGPLCRRLRRAAAEETDAADL